MIQDNTAKWQKKKLTNFASNEALPVGHIYQSLSKNVPVGSLPLLGGEYDRTLYADLWSWANENGLVVSESEWQAQANAQGGSCAKFSDGNGSTTFRVPALNGNSDTVQPQSIVGMWLIVAYGTISNVGNVDIEHFINDLGNLENRVQPIELGGTDATTAEQALANLGALPKTGGKLTGTIIVDNNGNPVLCPSTDSSLLRLYGGYGYASHGANLDLYGEKSDNPGIFILRARTQEKFTALQGDINGSLTWGGKPVYTPDTVQIINNNNSGNTFTLPSGGTWKYFVVVITSDGDYSSTMSGTSAGGTTIKHSDTNIKRCTGLAFRVS